MSHFGYAMGARIVARSKRPGDDENTNDRNDRRRVRPLAWLRRLLSWRPTPAVRHSGTEVAPSTAPRPGADPQPAAQPQPATKPHPAL